MKKQKKCTIANDSFFICNPGKIDVKERRKQLKAVVKAFNQQFNKMVNDDQEIIKIEFHEEINRKYQGSKFQNDAHISLMDMGNMLPWDKFYKKTK